MTGRRAALGVAFKNAKRNKKRSFYLVLLIGLPVLVAVMTAAVVRAGYISPAEQAISEYGSANVKIEQWFPTAEASEWAGAAIDDIDPEATVLTYRHDFKSFGPRLHGRVSDIDLDAALSEGILTLTSGRAPAETGEVVLSEHLANELGLGVEDTTVLTLRGNEEGTYQVVGLASHPILWRLDEVVVSPDEMDLINTNGQVGEIVLIRSQDDQAFGIGFNQRWERERYSLYPQNVDWPMPEDLHFLPEDYYAAMSDEQIAEARAILEGEGIDSASNYAYGLFPNGVSVGLPQVYAETLTDRLSWNQVNLAESPPVIGTAVAAVILAEVAFIAGAAFATGTRRRLREIGLMGANGADDRQLKTSVIGEGLVAGLGGGLLGAGIGLVLLIAGRSVLQQFVDRRIEDFPLSIFDLAGPIGVAVISCVIAAWLPAKTASGVPILTALQGRMPVAKPKRWVIPAGMATAGFGTLLLAVGLATASSSGSAVAVIGAILMIGGAAFLAGPIVAWVSKHAERFPVTSRIVLRDSGRQRGRAAAAVAATMVILMAPVGGLAAMGANHASSAIYGLPPEHPQVLIEGAFDENYELVPLTEADLLEVQDRLPEARIAPAEVLDARVEYPAELEARRSETTEDDGGYYVGSLRMAVANDELLAMLDDPRIGEGLEEDGIVLVGVEERETTVSIDGEEVAVAEVPVGVARYAFPRLLVTDEVAAGLGFQPRLVAVVEVDPTWNPFGSPFEELWSVDEDQFAISGGSDTIPGAVVAFGFLATMLVVLIVVATVTALSAAEADDELRTVVAVGATNSIRRRYLGLQSGLHTMIGALLAIPLTLLLYKTVVMASGSYQTVGNFGVWRSSDLVIPWAGLALLVVGLPVAIALVTAITVRSAPTTPPRRAT